ncbi:FAD-dependent oxidoreductase [Amycolatopsis lurida]
MKVLVIGAGVGGMAAALSLLAAGHEVEVFEQGEKLRAAGNGVILWPNGTGILADLGVSLDDLGTRMDSLQIRAKDGKPLFWFQAGKIADKLGAPCMLVPRGDLVARMAGMLPEGCLRLGKRCTGLKTGGAAPVVASFDDGTEAEGDVLLGADGHRSIVRRELMGERPASYTGWATWHGITPSPEGLVPDHRVQTFVGNRALCALHPVGNGLVHWAFETPWSDGEVAPPPVDDRAPEPDVVPSPVVRLKERFGDWTGPVPELLATITDDDISVFPHIIHDVPENWGHGPVSLLGDAVHVVPPRVAMGVNQALEDAWVLGRTLTDAGDHEAQLRGYEKVRQRRVRKVQARAQGAERENPVLPIFVLLARNGIPLTWKMKLDIKQGSNFLNDDVHAAR